VEIISPSWMRDDSNIKYEGQKRVNVDEDISVIFCPSWKTSNKVTRNIKVMFSLVWLFIYLIFNVKSHEKIIAYHVPWISIPIRAAKRIKKLNLILEIGEMYSEIWVEANKFKNMEKKLIECSDMYLFASSSLKKRVLKNKVKRYIYYHASYETYAGNKIKDNDVINLVYVGSVDLTKGGAFKAINILKFLPSNYTLHILGYGELQLINKLKDKINTINHEKNKDVCFFVGTLFGNQYSDYLLKCDIALNPQNLGKSMETAFPSKIISYLAHGMVVVSTEIESIKNSSIANNIHFVESNEPKSIANTILNINLSNEVDTRATVETLADKFLIEMKELLIT